MSRETHIVGFRLGRETYGVPITSLHEIVRVPEITAVPDMREYIRLPEFRVRVLGAPALKRPQAGQTAAQVAEAGADCAIFTLPESGATTTASLSSTVFR